MIYKYLPSLSSGIKVGSVFAMLGVLILAAWGAERPHTKPEIAATDTAKASSSERFQDWGINCNGESNQRFCTLAYELRRREDNRRIVLLEVKPLDTDQALAGLTLPFGLALEAGVTLQIDESPTVLTKRYHSCMPEGCLVALKLDAGTLDAMKNGQTLKVSAPIVTGGKANFILSLKGFTTAYSRMVQIAAANQSANH
ncbi:MULTISPECIES: invasion associated locus B family protein [unclassified Pseudomonas]|uniref:invasion associated locus B family protein n=1 Tax=unclassified Pseudomonas TaxID=196821 RepID=UPI002005E6DC|nr:MULTISPECIES: invasion associated locus B family protein [unclassified Pseudomonas]MCK6189972.1 invasion associated locus B family protein [Pseudomonas sp. EYE_354]WLH66893.1 invasion associated locus B family protein [Pseudomonas sp. FP2309]